MNFTVREYKPSPHLKPYIDCYWEGIFNTESNEWASFKMVPNGCLELIVHLDERYCNLPNGEAYEKTPDYMLIGLATMVTEVRFTSAVPVFSMRFKPEGINALFRLGGGEVLGRFADIEDLMPVEMRDTCHRLREQGDVLARIRWIEKYFSNIITQQRKTADIVSHAAELMRNSEANNIGEIARAVAISTRQLERRFKEVVGITPKRYMRLARINRVMRALEYRGDLNLTSIAYHCGYFDQAHFIRDFKSITGYNPTRYTRNREEFVTLYPMEARG